ncbi:hypothetical protein [Bufonid herpesvirus 1]|uniref:hypothetical protein n=1 Tax=Bufonid herpesvirus 1 TaxID=2282206 RepID=UPI000EB74ECE|nr:hypothetical protein [Bufonid herpesvirus 1]AXF48537.1 hypothetical protein [Bufonid herpesvirus 1]
MSFLEIDLWSCTNQNIVFNGWRSVPLFNIKELKIKTCEASNNILQLPLFEIPSAMWLLVIELGSIPNQMITNEMLKRAYMDGNVEFETAALSISLPGSSPHKQIIMAPNNGANIIDMLQAIISTAWVFKESLTSMFVDSSDIEQLFLPQSPVPLSVCKLGYSVFYNWKKNKFESRPCKWDNLSSTKEVVLAELPRCVSVATACVERAEGSCLFWWAVKTRKSRWDLIPGLKIEKNQHVCRYALIQIFKKVVQNQGVLLPTGESPAGSTGYSQ